MIVTNKGTIPGTVPPIWAGEEMKCGNCNFRATLETGDQGIEIVNRDRPASDPVLVRMECPTCAEPIELEIAPDAAEGQGGE